MTRALITGITGQDGRYLSRLLAARGDEVWGMPWTDASPDMDMDMDVVRWTSPAAMSDAAAIVAAVEMARPDLVFHLAAQSSVFASWTDPGATAESTGAGTAHVLEAVRAVTPDARVFVASSSAIFGVTGPLPHDEESPIAPVSPYGAAKAYTHHLARVYREGFGMFVCSGILFNHESPLRGPGFVTRKIVDGAVAVAQGRQRELVLGNLAVRRDWGFAGDVVRAMTLMLDHDEPDDYVVATGISHGVVDWCESAFRIVGLDWQDHVRSEPSLMRPGEPPDQIGDASRARRVLGWAPEVGFDEMVAMMVAAELERVAEGRR